MNITRSLLFVLPLISCGGNTEEQGQAASVQEEQQATQGGTVEVAEFKRLLAERPGQLVDVRTPGEWAGGVIPGSAQIDFQAADFQDRITALDKERPVYVYCAAGGRSRKAMEQMDAMGFKEVYDLAGGMGAWSSSGGAVVPPSSAAQE